MCVSERERERERESTRNTENKKTILTRAIMNQQLQREREGAYVGTFSVSSLTSTTSWERGRSLNYLLLTKYV